MYLFPTKEEMDSLYRQINPTARIMDYQYSRPPAPGSMAEFFMESEDVELSMEDDCTEFDYIEDEILNMKRDINGFRMPREQIKFAEPAPNHPLLERVSNWGEI